MVTDDELEGIRRLRGAGKTHQEIADELGLKRSTVAYQLQKVKSSDEDSSINMIYASGFKPQETLISFDNHSFESHRVKGTLYTTGTHIYEMRGGVIHSTEIRKPFLGSDYPRLAPIIREHGQNWYLDVVYFARQISSASDSIFKLDSNLIREWEALGLDPLRVEKFVPNIYLQTYKKAFEGLPETPGMCDPSSTEISVSVEKSHASPSGLKSTLAGIERIKEYEGWQVDCLLFMHSNYDSMDWEIPLRQDMENRSKKALMSINRRLSFNSLISKSGFRMTHKFPRGDRARWKVEEKNLEARQIIEEELAKKTPKLIVDYYKELGYDKEDILFVRKNNINSPEELQAFRDSGLEEFSQFIEMRGHEVDFRSYEQYQECKSLTHLLYPKGTSGALSPQQREIDRNAREIDSLGIIIKSKGLRMIHPNFLYLAKTHREWPHWTVFGLHLKDILSDIGTPIWQRYRRNQEFFHATGLSPNPTNYKWVDKQSDSQLNSLKRFPSPRAATVYDTIATSPTQSLMLDSLIRIHNESRNPGPTIEDQDAMHAILSKKPFTDICISSLESGFVERYQNGKPLLDISKFEDLRGKDSPINKKVISAINRNAADDSLTSAWTRFEASSKELWARDLEEPLPTNGQVAVRMVDEMAKLVKFTPAMGKDLHLARQLRNDVIHGDDPREEIKPKHVRRVLEATEKIIEKLNN